MGSRTIQPLKFNGETIYIEVSEVDQRGRKSEEDDRFEDVNALDKFKEVGGEVYSIIKGLGNTVQSALENAQPEEWSLEINLGFNAKTGIPFVTEGAASGAVKVIAKWKRA